LRDLTHPSCLAFASGVMPSHCCPRIRLEPSAWGPGSGWSWGPHGSVPGPESCLCLW